MNWWIIHWYCMFAGKNESPPALISILLALLLLTGCSAALQSPTISTAPLSEREKLHALFAAYWDDSMRLYPTWATSLGDLRFNDQYRITDGEAFREEAMQLARQNLADIAQIDREQLTGQDLLSYDLFVRVRQEYLERQQFPHWLVPVNQYNQHLYFMRQGTGTNNQRFKTVKHYEDWFARLGHVDELTTTQIANMKEGLRQGYSRSRAVMEKVLDQFDGMIVEDVEDSPLWQSIGVMPESIPAAERERLTATYRELLTDDVMPAYRRMRDYLRDDYLPNCRETEGLVHLPNGREWYAHRVRSYTTTSFSAEEIHAIGLELVAELHASVHEVMEQVGFDGTLQEFFAFMKEDEQFYLDTPEEVIAAFYEVGEKTTPLLAKMFDVRPEAGFEIRPVEAFREKTASTASYRRASPDGSRPGVFYLNFSDMKIQPIYRSESLYLHEAEPGHHFAGSIHRELKDLPNFRRYLSYTAYSEGWALYAETLGYELGLFTDPYQRYGALDAQLFRAIRLVVDTGIHHYGWTAQQARDYMTENSSLPDAKVHSEVNRYISRPGQALAYMIGKREILAMRERAEQALGDRFDIKVFHRQILTDGSLPMDLLAAKLDRWVKSQ